MLLIKSSCLPPRTLLIHWWKLLYHANRTNTIRPSAAQIVLYVFTWQDIWTAVSALIHLKSKMDQYLEAFTFKVKYAYLYYKHIVSYSLNFEYLMLEATRTLWKSFCEPSSYVGN